MTSFLNSSEGKKYREMFSGTKPGSPSFNNIYSKIANQDPANFNEAQHLFIKRTHYDPVESIASSMGINVSDRAIQEALWSQAVQHGRKGNKKILEGALKLADPKDTPSFLRAIYSSRGSYVNGLSINSDVKGSILNRYSNELKDVLSISGSGGSETIIMEPDIPVKSVSVDVPVSKTEDTVSSNKSTPASPNVPGASGTVTSTNMSTGEVTQRQMSSDEELSVYTNLVKRRYQSLRAAIAKGDVLDISRNEENLRDAISSLRRYLKSKGIDPNTIPEARAYRRKKLDELDVPSAPVKDVKEASAPANEASAPANEA